MPVLPSRPPQKGLKGRTVRLPEGMWDEIDAMAEAKGYSSNEAVVLLLRYAMEEERKDQGHMRPTRGR